MVRLQATNAWFLAIYRMAQDKTLPVEATVRAAELGTWEISFVLGGKRQVHIVPVLSAMR